MTKSKVAVVVDSTAYIPPELVEKYNLFVIPQILNWEGESLLDDIDIKPTEFYSRLKTAKEMPTTSQPSAGEFFDFFAKVADQAESIVAVLISEQFSGTLGSAHAAKEMMKDFPLEIVDSRSASMGLGFIALAAARAVTEGADYRQAADVARGLVPKMKVLFVVDTLEFLHRGGRIGGAQRLVGSMLSIKPVLHIDDGRIEPLASVRTKKKAIERVLEFVSEDAGKARDVRAAIIHAAAPDAAASLANSLNDKIKTTELLIAELSPVVGANVGPGTLGIAYYVAA